jgi:carbonic anhydrase
MKCCSILYGIKHLRAPLVVVMGHQSCGAVGAALSSDEALAQEPEALMGLVRHIRQGERKAVMTWCCIHKLASSSLSVR